jgi:succinyldiaminopimelate transaminase
VPASTPRAGFVPPPYPYSRLDALKRVAEQTPGGLVDLSIGTPCDPLPRVVADAFVQALDLGVGYPASIGTAALRDAARRWMARRLDVDVTSDAIIACVGTKEAVTSLPHFLHLRDPTRDVILYPAVAYPSYEMGAALARCRGVPVPVDDEWHLDLSRVADADAERALILWVNEPGNPSGSAATPARLAATVAWARERGILVASDECYVEFTYGPDGRAVPGVSALGSGPEGVIAIHSLSKRSNMAGMRSGFIAGDRGVVEYLGEMRKHAGLMVPGPVQAAAAAAWDDDAHVQEQQQRYAERRALMSAWLAEAAMPHAGGPATFYLWARAPHGDGWELTAQMAEAGTLVSPGEFFGPAGREYVRIALVTPLDRLELALERLARAFARA